MTQQSRTTETINRDHEAIRDIMHQVRGLTVPDRATLAVELVGHLATMMNRGQMTRLMTELNDEAQRVQDVPPGRQRDEDRKDGAGADATRRGNARGAERGERTAARAAASADPQRGNPSGDVLRQKVSGNEPPAHEGVGQAGRGEFRSGRLL